MQLCVRVGASECVSLFVCVSWSRSLEAACCALICALTVCEHSKGSISALCGISHRSHLSAFISYTATGSNIQYMECLCVCLCLCVMQRVNERETDREREMVKHGPFCFRVLQAACFYNRVVTMAHCVVVQAKINKDGG